VLASYDCMYLYIPLALVLSLLCYLRGEINIYI